LFGNELWSWRAFDFALFLASAVFLADLAKRAAGPVAGRAALILCPPAYAGVSYWLAGQHDMSAAQFLAPALWFHVRAYERRNAWLQIGTGVFIAAAMLCKPTVGAIGLLLPLQAAWARVPIGQIVAHTAVAGTTSGASLLLALAALMAHGTSWSELVDAVYTYNVGAQYIGPQTLPDMLLWVLEFHYRWVPMVALGAIPAIWWMIRAPERSMAAAAAFVLWTAGVLSFFIQWHGVAYHLAPCLLALCMLLAISFGLLADGRLPSARSVRNVMTAAVALSLAAIAVKLGSYYRSLPGAFLAKNYDAHLSRFYVGDDVNVADVLDAVRRVDALPAQACVLLVGDPASINYLAKRHMGTRFYYYHVLKYARMPLAKRWTDLWAADLRAADCPIAFISRAAVTEWLPRPEPAPTALRNFLDHYRPAGVIGARGGLIVYERL
jgi:hypothetical protein